MLVTKIQELTKNRFKVFLDSGLSFPIYKGELKIYEIHENSELKSDHFKELMSVVLPKRAKLRAMNLLKTRPYTVKAMRDKLTDGGYPENIIDEAIDYVSSFNYLNDAQYARDYIYTYKDRKNKNCIFRDLSNKGIAKEIIIEAYEEEAADDQNELEKAQILKFVTKKGYFDREFTFNDKQKLLASLYRKGFSIDLINKVLEENR